MTWSRFIIFGDACLKQQYDILYGNIVNSIIAKIQKVIGMYF